MKRIFICLTLLVGVIGFSKAQTIKPAIGVNFTDVVNNGDGSASGRAGWQFGGSIAFGDKIYFEPGVFYQTKSADFRTTDDIAPDDFEAVFKGFRVPVAIGWNILGNAESTVSLRAFGGASGFFLTSVDDGLDKDDINSPAWGVFAGAGLDFWILFLDASYEWSVTDIQKDLSAIDLGRTNGFFVNAGLRIDL